MSDIQLSVVIPTFNRESLLKEMVQSLATQTFPTDCFEVLVVIDGGTDGTQAMLNSLDTPFPLRPIYQQNAGPSRARNHGAKMAKGDIVLFLDDDLLPEPQLFDAHMDHHSKDDNALVLGRFLPEEGKSKGGWNTWEEKVFENHYRKMESGKRPPAGRRLYSGNFSLHREVFLGHGGFDESLLRGEDVELGFRLEQAGVRFYFSPQASALHRGYRSYQSWCTSAYLYGRTDVQLALQRGHEQVIPEVMSWYFKQPTIARRVTEVALGRKRTHTVARLALRTAADIANRLGRPRISHVGYSGIYKLQYWQGVADELGGNTVFFRHVQEWNNARLSQTPAH